MGIILWVTRKKPTPADSTPEQASEKHPTLTPEKEKSDWGVGKTISVILAIAVGFCVVLIVTNSIWGEKKPVVVCDNRLAIIEFPTSGEGYATMDKPIKAYIDPHKTHTRPVGCVRYTFFDNPSIWIIERGPVEGNSGIDVNKFLSMPAGRYVVTPEGTENAFLRWWQ
jgi:hypothetical protein